MQAGGLAGETTELGHKHKQVCRGWDPEPVPCRESPSIRPGEQRWRGRSQPRAASDWTARPAFPTALALIPPPHLWPDVRVQAEGNTGPRLREGRPGLEVDGEKGPGALALGQGSRLAEGPRQGGGPFLAMRVFWFSRPPPTKCLLHRHHGAATCPSHFCMCPGVGVGAEERDLNLGSVE